MYTSETPPDLYIFASWHLRGAYRKAYIADTIYAKLRHVASVDELRERMDNPSSEEIPIHKTVREIFDLPHYVPELFFLDPTPAFVGWTLQNFLKFYNETRGGLIDQVADKTTINPDDDTEDSGNDVPRNDNYLNANDQVQEDSDDDALPPAPKGEMIPIKRGRGRPRKILVPA